MTYQFKIKIKHSTAPPIWRRVIVPSSLSFFEFHLVIQVAFGWENAHLFMFSPKGWRSQPQIQEVVDGDDSTDGFDVVDADETKLSDVFTTEKQKYTYIYDFGDDWHHDITLEKILSERLMYPTCTAGRGACPPEDCGGIWGYLHMQEVLSDKSHPEYARFEEWHLPDGQEVWDSDQWNIKEVQQLFISVFQQINKDKS